MRFITQLLPLLLASSLPCHVISVFGPQRDEKLILDDLSLRSPKNYSFMASGSHTAYLTTFFMEHLAAQYPGRLSLVHYFPGLVLTDAFEDPSLPKLFRWTFRYGHPLIRLFTVPGPESGERIMFLTSTRFPAKSVDADKDIYKSGGKGEIAVSSDGVVGGGAYKVNWNGEMIPTGKQYKNLREDGWLEKVRSHTMKAFEEIEAGKVFAG